MTTSHLTHLHLPAFFAYWSWSKGLEWGMVDSVDNWLRNGFKAIMVCNHGTHNFMPIIDIADAIASSSTLEESQS